MLQRFLLSYISFSINIILSLSLSLSFLSLSDLSLYAFLSISISPYALQHYSSSSCILLYFSLYFSIPDSDIKLFESSILHTLLIVCLEVSMYIGKGETLYYSQKSVIDIFPFIKEWHMPFGD